MINILGPRHQADEGHDQRKDCAQEAVAQLEEMREEGIGALLVIAHGYVGYEMAEGRSRGKSPAGAANLSGPLYGRLSRLASGF